MTNHIDGFFTVSIQDQDYFPRTQTSADKESYWQRILKEARTKGWVPRCKCNPEAKSNQLAIRRHSGATESYSLARYPNQGAMHLPTCRFYAAKPELSGLQGYTTGVVEETEDGIKIRLDLDHKVREVAAPTAPAAKNTSPKGVPRSRKAAMSLLGLMHLLFSLGRLNVWYPKMKNRRSWSVVARVLLEQAGRIVCGSAPLDEQLLLGIRVEGMLTDDQGRRIEDAGMPSRKRIKAHNEALVTAAESANRRLVVVGMLANYAAFSKDASLLPERLPFKQWDGLPYMTCETAFWLLAERRFKTAWAAWKSGRPVCAIAHIEYFAAPGQSKRSWQVVDLALQGLSNSFIPVESSYELEVADSLVDKDRLFEKPLRYDATESEVFPDFVLLDTTQHQYPMEVFGRTDEAYEIRADEKREYYEKHFAGQWWSWIANRGAAMPAFPPAKSE